MLWPENCDFRVVYVRELHYRWSTPCDRFSMTTKPIFSLRIDIRQRERVEKPEEECPDPTDFFQERWAVFHICCKMKSSSISRPMCVFIVFPHPSQYPSKEEPVAVEFSLQVWQPFQVYSSLLRCRGYF